LVHRWKTRYSKQERLRTNLVRLTLSKYSPRRPLYDYPARPPPSKWATSAREVPFSVSLSLSLPLPLLLSVSLFLSHARTRTHRVHTCTRVAVSPIEFFSLSAPIPPTNTRVVVAAECRLPLSPSSEPHHRPPRRPIYPESLPRQPPRGARIVVPRCHSSYFRERTFLSRCAKLTLVNVSATLRVAFVFFARSPPSSVVVRDLRVIRTRIVRKQVSDSIVRRFMRSKCRSGDITSHVHAHTDTYTSFGFNVCSLTYCTWTLASASRLLRVVDRLARVRSRLSRWVIGKIDFLSYHIPRRTMQSVTRQLHEAWWGDSDRMCIFWTCHAAMWRHLAASA